MRTSELLARLRSLTVRLWADGDELGCSAPRGALTPELREALRERKQEILGLLGAAGTGAGPGAIERAAREGAFPLSFGQRRLWFLDQLEPGGTVYSMPLAWTLRGPLDPEVLRRALEEIVRRHDVLRARFVRVGGAPAQVIDPPRALELERVDVADLDQARALLAERAREPFDLGAGGLLRPALVRVAPELHVLSLLVHHAVFDGWSADVLLRELETLYPALLAGEEPALPALAIQYADYAAWQVERLARGELEDQVRYWRETLADLPPALELPTDRPRPAVQGHRGANERRALPAQLVARLEALARAEGVTDYMVFLAAFQALLARLAGQEDVVVGTVVAGRPRPDVEPLIGFFANTLVLRTGLAGDPSFRGLLARVREACLGAFEHQDVPFERLVEVLHPQRDLSRSPLFQALFMTESAVGRSRRVSELSLELLELETDVARTDLMLTVHGEAGGRSAWIEYDADLFDGSTVRRLLAHYEGLLAAAVAAPDLPLSHLELLSEEERELVLHAWNDTGAARDSAPLHVLFERSVARAPEAPALVVPGPQGAPDEVLSYRELEGRANRLARHLAARGVAPGSLVGLCLERSADLVVAWLAVSKAGAAYVPLDPSWPAERLAHMVGDAGLASAVTQRELVPLLPAGLACLALDEAREAIEAQDDAPLALALPPDARAYVIYTSGSTGRPKGVEVEHRSVAAFLAAMAVQPGFAAGERLLAVTTLSFDISVLELGLPLATGGTVVLASRADAADGGRLVELLARHLPHVLQATPSTWRLLLLAGWEGDPELRAFSGGEPLPRDLAEELLARAGEVWNLYGPTEATVWSTVRRVEPGAGPVPIGRPIPGTRAYVLDRHLRPAPIGVPGELWLAGAGVARGYLGRPELSAERFLADPFRPSDGERMYRTGDLARWLPEGELACLGRVDHQVKLRGFRIELEEVEAVLAEVPGVARCAAVVREDQPGDQRLVAYVVRAAGAELRHDALREAARRRLPAYMVPAAFVELDALPETPNGKLDRRALLSLAPARATTGQAHVAPRNDVEARIAEVWSAVLGLERVSVDASFFDLGGHSLLLAEAHARLRDGLDPRLTMVELFQYPTVGALAAHLAEARAGGAAPDGGANGAPGGTDGTGGAGATGGTDGPDGTGGPDGKGRRDDRGRDLAAGRQALMQRRRTKR